MLWPNRKPTLDQCLGQNDSKIISNINNIIVFWNRGNKISQDDGWI